LRSTGADITLTAYFTEVLLASFAIYFIDLILFYQAGAATYSTGKSSLFYPGEMGKALSYSETLPETAESGPVLQLCIVARIFFKVSHLDAVAFIFWF